MKLASITKQADGSIIAVALDKGVYTYASRFAAGTGATDIGHYLAVNGCNWQPYDTTAGSFLPGKPRQCVVRVPQATLRELGLA